MGSGRSASADPASHGRPEGEGASNEVQGSGRGDSLERSSTASLLLLLLPKKGRGPDGPDKQTLVGRRRKPPRHRPLGRAGSRAIGHHQLFPLLWGRGGMRTRTHAHTQLQVCAASPSQPIPSRRFSLPRTHTLSHSPPPPSSCQPLSAPFHQPPTILLSPPPEHRIISNRSRPAVSRAQDPAFWTRYSRFLTTHTTHPSSISTTATHRRLARPTTIQSYSYPLPYSQATVLHPRATALLDHRSTVRHDVARQRRQTLRTRYPQKP